MNSSKYPVQGLWKAVSGERGSVINIALLFLLLLSLIIFAASRSTNVDIKIATNKKTYERTFYLAEGLTAQAIKVLENTKDSNDDDLRDPAAAGWPAGLLRQAVLSNNDFVTDADWTASSVTQTWPNTAAWSGGNPQPDTFRYIMVDEGLADGQSLSLASSRVYNYNVRGRAESGAGDVEISVGYKMRY
jgi:Tfp pilus assembly protein PilX